VYLVFDNLIQNANKHTPAGGQVDVHVRAQGEWVRFEVSDTGPGVPAAHRARIFERFAQVPGDSAQGAAGLGLYIAREVVRAHGGEIGVQDEAGRGSLFFFTLPLSLPTA
jgi:NtrC-family two-component system sensor histidine kinase KinB